MSDTEIKDSYDSSEYSYENEHDLRVSDDEPAFIKTKKAPKVDSSSLRDSGRGI